MTEAEEREFEEQANWNYQWKWIPIVPDSWGAVAKYINEYMQLPEGRVVYEERELDETKIVPPTLRESISDLLHGHLPRNRKIIVPGGKKFVLIKVLDDDGKTLVHTPLDQEVLSVIDGAFIVKIGTKLKRAINQPKM